MTNNSYEYIVCNKLYRIRYLLNHFNRFDKPCYCKSKLYEYSSIFASKFIIHTLYMIDKKVIPDRSGIFSEYYEYVASHSSVSEFLTNITSNIVNFYYELVYDEYVNGLRYLFENYDLEFFSDFIDDIIDKFFENVLIIISGFSIKCHNNCINMCHECSLSINNRIKFYLFDEFVANKNKLLELIKFIESRVDCRSIDLIIEGKFLSNKNCDTLGGIYNYVKSIFKSVELSGLSCDKEV